MTDVPTLQPISDTRLPNANLITRITHTWNSLSWLHRALAGLVLLRLLIALLIMLNVLPLLAEMRFGWHLHHGGDHDIMFRLARSIVEGKPAPEVVGLGQSLVMIPFIVLMRPYYYTDMVVPLVLINGFLLAGLSVFCLGLLVKHTTGSDRAAFWSAALWSILPLLAYIALFWNLPLRAVFVPMLGWLNGLSDGPAAFFILLATLLLAQTRLQRPTLLRMFVLGVVLTAAITFRIHLIFIVITALFYVLIQHGWRSLIATGIGGLVAYVPQGWYNWVVFKRIFTTGYLSMFSLEKHQGVYTGQVTPRPLSQILPTLPFSRQNIMQLFDQLFGDRLWLLIPAVLSIAAMGAVCLILWKRQGWQSVYLLIALPMSYLLPMSTAWPFREDPVRYSIPAMPFLIAVGIYALLLITQYSSPKIDFRES